MNSQKATYWFALALAAFALNSEYQRGAFPTLHKAADSAGATLCRMATNAERTVAMARLMAARPTIPDDELPSLEFQQFADVRQLSEDQKEMVRDQVRAQVEIIRARVRQHRGQLVEIRDLARQQVHLADSMNRRVVVVGPGNCKTSVRVPALPELPELPAPVDDDDTF